MAEKPLPSYDGDEPYVFVSYSHEDHDLVYPEIHWLQDQGFNVWYDEGISGASRWRDAIAGRLGACHLLLFFVSPNSVQSQVCREELEFVLDLGRPILSVHLESTALPDGIKLAIANRQALFRDELESEDYERKLLSTVATYLEQPIPATETRHSPARKRLPRVSLLSAVVLFGLGVGIAALATWVTVRPELPTPRPLERFALDLFPAGFDLPSSVTNPFAISADGRHIVFNRGTDDGVRRLYVRSLDALEAVPIRGVEGDLGSVFISPDGKWVAYYDRADRAIKKVRVSGGSPVTLTKGIVQGLTWSRDGTIIFSILEYPGLMRIPDSGGTPEPLTEPPEGELHWYPSLLADGTAVVFAVGSSDSYVFDRIAVLSLISGEQRILTAGSVPQVTSSGHLLFAREGSIWAMAFDADRLEVSGAAVPVLESVAYATIAADGSMVYLPGSSSELSDTLVWVDLDGHETAVAAPAGRYFSPRVSPDGHRVAVGMVVGEMPSGVWIHSLERNTTTKLTLADAVTYQPGWSPDGKKVMYSSNHDGTSNLYWRNADGTGEEELVMSGPPLGHATANRFCITSATQSPLAAAWPVTSAA